MVRSQDTPGADKHLRFGKYTEALSALLVGFPGVKSIVLHTHGATGEHPHLHVWWQGEKAVTNQTVRDRLKKYDQYFLAMKSQNDWSFRNHESYDTWAAYVQRNKTHKVLHGELPPPKDIIMLEIPNTPAPAAPSAPPPVKIKKLTAEERLINYCLREEGFKYGQWGLAHYELGSDYRSKMFADVKRALITYANGRLDNRQIVYMGRNIMWHFADEDLRDVFTRNWAAEAEKFW